MSARGMSARGLRAFLLVSAITLCCGLSANASDLGTLNVAYNGSIDSGVGNTGRFVWTRKNSPNQGTFSTSIIAAGSNFSSFCIDTQGATAGTYTVVDTIVGLPSPAATITATMAKQIGTLFENFVVNVSTLTNLNAKTSGSGLSATNTQNRANAAFQAALWAIAGNINGGLNGNGNNFSSSDTQVYAYAQSMYTFATTLANYNLYDENGASNQFKLLGMRGEQGGQDQIIVMDRPSFVQFVPVPTGVVMAGMGIVCLGGVNFLRRRKMVAAL